MTVRWIDESQTPLFWKCGRDNGGAVLCISPFGRRSNHTPCVRWGKPCVAWWFCTCRASRVRQDGVVRDLRQRRYQERLVVQGWASFHSLWITVSWEYVFRLTICGGFFNCLLSVDPGVYVLADFPHGYRLYTRVKRVDGQTVRRDSFLLGELLQPMRCSMRDSSAGSRTSRCSRFNSANETYLHFLWLARGRPLNDKGKPKCLCCKCSCRGQTIINRDMTRWLRWKTYQTDRLAKSWAHPLRVWFHRLCVARLLSRHVAKSLLFYWLDTRVFWFDNKWQTDASMRCWMAYRGFSFSIVDG